jgi:hypothetical protein
MNLARKAPDTFADWIPSTYGFDDRPIGVEWLRSTANLLS